MHDLFHVHQNGITIGWQKLNLYNMPPLRKYNLTNLLLHMRSSSTSLIVELTQVTNCRQTFYINAASESKNWNMAIKWEKLHFWCKMASPKKWYFLRQSCVRTLTIRSGLFPVCAELHQCCPLSLILFVVFMDRISRCSHGAEGIWESVDLIFACSKLFSYVASPVSTRGASSSESKAMVLNNIK